MADRQIRISILIVMVVVIGLVVSGCGLLWPDQGLSDTERMNTDIPLTNTAIYRVYVQTEQALYMMATATQGAIYTAEARATANQMASSTAAAQEPNLATHQIPLTQTAVHADYVSTMGALDDMATGTAGALIAAPTQGAADSVPQQTLAAQGTAVVQTAAAADMASTEWNQWRDNVFDRITMTAQVVQDAPAGTQTAVYQAYLETADAWDMMATATQRRINTATAEAPVTLGGHWLRVTVDQLNVHSGPGTEYEIIGKVMVNEQYRVLGITTNYQWVAFDNNGQIGWANTESIELLGDSGDIPLIQPPPAPTPEASPTPAN